MRLTSIKTLDLPAGPLLSYAVRAGQPVGSVPISFDQRRHVSAGQRPGSWMAVAFTIPTGTTTTDLASAWHAVIDRHGTLRTVFATESDSLALREVTIEGGDWTQHPSQGRGGHELVREIFDRECRPFSSPSHHLVVAGLDTGAPRVILGLDHAHVDAWSLMALARDTLTALGDLAAGRAPDASMAPVERFAAHTAALEAMPPAPPQVQSRWSQIIDSGGGVMPTFGLPLGDVAAPAPEVVQIREVFDADELSRFEDIVAEHRIRMFTATVSVLTQVEQSMSGQPLRAVLPVHSRHDERWHSSVGWFITNAVLESSDPDPTACAAAIKEAIGLGSYPLAPIMSAYGGMPTGPGMFAISWLDNRRLPVSIDAAAAPQHVSAVIETDGVMIWFVVNTTGLHLRCRYPDTRVAGASVNAWLDAVCRGLRDVIQPGRVPAGSTA